MDCFPTKKNPLPFDWLFVVFLLSKVFSEQKLWKQLNKIYRNYCFNWIQNWNNSFVVLSHREILTEGFSAWSIYFQFLYACVNLGISARQRKWYVIEITLYYLSVMFLYQCFVWQFVNPWIAYFLLGDPENCATPLHR